MRRLSKGAEKKRKWIPLILITFPAFRREKHRGNLQWKLAMAERIRMNQNLEKGENDGCAQNKASENDEKRAWFLFGFPTSLVISHSLIPLHALRLIGKSMRMMCWPKYPSSLMNPSHCAGMRVQESAMDWRRRCNSMSFFVSLDIFPLERLPVFALFQNLSLLREFRSLCVLFSFSFFFWWGKGRKWKRRRQWGRWVGEGEWSGSVNRDERSFLVWISTYSSWGVNLEKRRERGEKRWE